MPGARLNLACRSVLCYVTSMEVVIMKTEVITLDKARNVTLTAYLQEAGVEFGNILKRPAVLVLPGGGYQFCSNREADPVATKYLAAGYQAFILRYSVREHAVWPNPLEDYEQAMKLIRSEAAQWNLYKDKVAVIGFSAGGHLAAAAATMAKERPNAAILGYAVAGEDVKGCSPTAPDTICAVDKNTCPCFLFSTRTDGVVHILNSIEFIKALAEHDIAFESHIYAYGSHGCSTCDSSVLSPDTVICSRTQNWVPDSIGWLRDVLGDFGANGMEPPVCKAHVNSNHEPFLSVDCTFGRIMGNAVAKAILDELMSKIREAGDVPEEIGKEDLSSAIKRLPMREVLSFLRIDDKMISMLDAQLRKIPNN